MVPPKYINNHMKILLINDIGIEYAGAEVLVKQLKEGLLSLGHETRVLSGDRPMNPNTKFSDYSYRSFYGTSKSRFLLYFLNPFAMWSLYKVLRDFNPDVVHINKNDRPSPFILWVLRNTPTVMTIHDHLTFDPTRINDLETLKQDKGTFSDYFISKKSPRYYGERVRFFLFRRFFKNVHTTIVSSNFFGLSAKSSNLFRRVKVIHNGIKLGSWKKITNYRKLLFLGRIDKAKGIGDLLLAMPSILSQIPEVELVIAGDGEDKKNYEKMVQDLGISKNVNFLGKIPQDKTKELISDSTIVTVPSDWPDNLPTVCIEAMSQGRPLVGTNVGGIPEMIVDGKNGFLINPAKPPELAEAILKLLHDKTKCDEFGKYGREYCEKNFSFDVYINKIIQTYKEALNNN